MHVVVMGCGRVGSGLAIKLDELGHSVSVVDQQSDAFRRLGHDFGGERITGVGFDQETLMRAGIERADAFAAVSSGDNSNIIAARVARESFGVARVVARIYDPKRAAVYERLGIPTIASVPWATGRFLKGVLGAQLVEEWRDPSGAVALAQLAVHPGWVTHRLADFEAATGARVALIMRFGTGFVPTASTVLQSDDVTYVVGTDDELTKAKALAGKAPEATA